jgi:dCTP diphosphatase
MKQERDGNKAKASVGQGHAERAGLPFVSPLQWLPADEARDRLRQEPLHTRASEEMADVLVYLVGLADQCGIDLGSAALAKVAASADKYPTDENRGVAPDKT